MSPRMAGHKLAVAASDRWFAGVMSQSACVTKCEQANRFMFCLSLNYNKRQRTCFLSTTNRHITPNRYRANRKFVYYERTVVCQESGCQSDPCQNGGECLTLVNPYVCKCPHGFAGVNCEYSPVTCAVWGVVHYTTFDNLEYQYPGTAKYVMVKLIDSAPPSLRIFRILGKNEHRIDGVTSRAWLKYVEVELDGHVIRIGPNRDIYVDGELKPTGAVYPTFRVQNFGLGIRFESDFGLVVHSDFLWTTAISIPPQYFNQLEGMCGNYDGIGISDFLDDVGTDVERGIRLGNHWVVDDPEDPSAGVVTSWTDNHYCDSNVLLQIASEDRCGLMLSWKEDTPFEDCIRGNGTIPLSKFTACEFDICSTQGHGLDDKQTACHSLASFEIACEHSGYVADWRGRANCSAVCPPGMEYMSSTSACPDTCEEPRASDACPLPDKEGCVCPIGSILRGDKCVLPEECSCYDAEGDKQIELGATYMTDTCVQMQCVACQTCGLGVTKLVVTSSGCAENELCVRDLMYDFLCYVLNDCEEPSARSPPASAFDGRRFAVMFQNTTPFAVDLSFFDETGSEWLICFMLLDGACVHQTRPGHVMMWVARRAGPGGQLLKFDGQCYIDMNDARNYFEITQ